MRPPVRGLSLLLLATMLAFAAGASGSAAAKKATKKSSCPAGEVPIVKAAGTRAMPVLDRKGRVRCTTPKRPAARAVPAPSATPGAQMGAVADALDHVLVIAPRRLAPLQRKIGAKRTKKLLAIALDSWRSRAAALTARAARGPRAHAAETTTTSFTPVAGADVKIGAEFTTVDDGTTGGYKGSATVEGDFTRGGIDKLVEKAGGGSLPPDVKDGHAKLTLHFADLPSVCPDAAGKVKGSLKAGGKLTLSVGATQITLAAEVDVTYALQVGEDARWKTIDDLDVQTTFTIGGTGRGTDTWRARRTGTGFAHDGIFSGKDVGTSIGDDAGHLNAAAGGIWGPGVGINWANGGPTAWDFRSVDKIKGLIATNYANAILTLAALEYVREVAAERVEKHWFDDEACLKVDAAAAKAKLRASETTTVTARNARAANGQPVATNLTASGTQSLQPGSAPMPAGASHDFTLTAPSTTPTRSSWKVVALSRAGKKTVSGELGDEQGPYTVTLDDHETGNFATHATAGHLTGTLSLAAVDGSDPQRWTAGGPVTWDALTATSKISECSFGDPVPAGSWTATVTALDGDRIAVVLSFSSDTFVTWTVFCEGTQVAGEPGVSPLGMTPQSFELPAGGGTQVLSGSVQDGGEGFFTDGTLTVTPVTG